MANYSGVMQSIDEVYMEHNLYDSPESELNSDASVGPIKPGLILKILLILFTILSSGSGYLSSLLQDGNFSFAVGGAIAPIIFGGLVVGLFQIGKRFRNTRSQYKIFLWCQVFFFISTTFNLLSLIGQRVSA